MLAVCVWIAFSPALGNGFVDLDDPDWIVNNPSFRCLGWQQVRWAFTTTVGGVYQPLGWLVQGLTYVLFGLDPWGYHLVSLLFHIANTVLLHRLCVVLVARGMPEAVGRLGPGHPWWPAARKVLVEKGPILAFCVAFGAVSFLAKRNWLDPEVNDQPVIVARVAQACSGAWFYLAKTVWPFGITVFYPRPEGDEFGTPLFAASVVGFVLAVAVAYRMRRRWPWLAATLAVYVVIVAPYLGLALARQGRYDDALAELRDAVKRDRGNPDAHHVLAAVLVASGRVGEASAEFEEVLRLRPEHPQARAFLAKVRHCHM